MDLSDENLLEVLSEIDDIDDFRNIIEREFGKTVSKQQLTKFNLWNLE